jgi:hypothetical protein
MNINKLNKSDIWMIILAIPISCVSAYYIVVEMQELVTIFHLNPQAVFIGLNFIGLLLCYLGIKLINWADNHHNNHDFNMTPPNIVKKTPTNVDIITQTKLPFKNCNHVTPAAIQNPPKPNHENNIIAIPKHNTNKPINLIKAVNNIFVLLLKLFNKKDAF